MKRARTWTVARALASSPWPAVGIVAVILIGVEAGRAGAWATWALSFLNALLFLAVGAILRDLDKFRPTAAYYRWIFYNPRGRVKLGSNFLVVIPRFEPTLDHTGQTGNFISTALTKEHVNHAVTLDSVIANNDSESAFLLSGTIVRLTGGRYPASYVLDTRRRDSLAAVVLGLYSNDWTENYWRTTQQDEHPLLKPMPRQAGFMMRSPSEQAEYIQFCPLSFSEEPIADFLASEDRRIKNDYALLAKLAPRSAGRPNESAASILLITSIAATGTVKLAEWLSFENRLRDLMSAFQDQEEFGIVFEVPHHGGRDFNSATPIYSFPTRRGYSLWGPESPNPTRSKQLQAWAIPEAEAHALTREFQNERSSL